MYLIRGLQNIELFKARFGDLKLSATIGNFDGLHIGHQHILDSVKDHARGKDFASMVFFTEPHASEYFAEFYDAKKSPPRICPWREKVTLLKDYGIDFAFFLKFNPALNRMSPEEFIKQVLEQLNLKYLRVGDDFRFGKDRAGGFNMLTDWGQSSNVEVVSTKTILFKDRRVSSTWIREALQKDDFKLASQLLGRPYYFSGKVVRGQQLGRTIGIPTANLWMPKQRLPVSGVYAVSCSIDGARLDGIANMGIRPTVGGSSPVLEVHLFNFNKNIYGKRIKVEFKNKIREEQKFDNIDALKDQIHKDINVAKKLLNN